MRRGEAGWHFASYSPPAKEHLLVELEAHAARFGITNRVVEYRSSATEYLEATVLSSEGKPLDETVLPSTDSVPDGPRRWQIAVIAHHLSSVSLQVQWLAECYSVLAVGLWGDEAAFRDAVFSRIKARALRGTFAAADAVLASLRSALDSTRFLLLPPGARDVPRNLEGALNLTSTSARAGAAKPLETYWNAGGKRLKAYRDCIAHYVPVRQLPGYGYAGMQDSTGFAAATLNLPSNPEARSVKSWTYVPLLDLFVYCWRAASEATACLRVSVPELLALD